MYPTILFFLKLALFFHYKHHSSYYYKILNYHAPQARHKIYFFLSKEISYDSLQKSWAFQPTGLQYISNPRLPSSYTIVPINEWNSFTPTAIPTSSLVCIHTAGLYHNALGYVIGASINQVNECTLIAVLP